MAINKINLLFIFIVLSTAQTLHRANAVDVANEWCQRTTHKAVCLSIVEADKRATLKTSPNGIATILTENALATATSTSAKISRLLKTANKGHEVAALESCLAAYSGAVASLKTADFKAIDRQNYATLVAAISNANDAPRDCELSFQEPPAVPSPVTAENERLRGICATTLEIVNLVVCKSPSFC